MEIDGDRYDWLCRIAVTTCVVVWIEISFWYRDFDAMAVTTCVVVWIEISGIPQDQYESVSPPAWWCGLK